MNKKVWREATRFSWLVPFNA